MAADRRLRVALAGDGDAAATLRAVLAATQAFELEELAGRAQPEPLDVVVLVHEGTSEPREELAQLREHTAAPVVLATTAPSSELVRWALDAGVADVLWLPAPQENVLFVVEKAAQTARQLESGSGDGRVVTVFSPKGGSGKSVVSTNLAVAAATHAGTKTLLIDLDLQFGDAAIMLGLAPDNTVRELLGTPTALDGEKLGVYTERHSSGVDVLPAPMSPEDAELVGEEAIRSLLRVAREAYDLVVVDTAPFFYGPMLATLDQTDELLLLCNPDVPTLKNVRLTLKTLELLSFPEDRLRIVLNRASANLMDRGDVEAALDRKVDWVLAARPVRAGRRQRLDPGGARAAGRTVRRRDVGARPCDCRRRLGRQAEPPGGTPLQLWEELNMSLQQRINGADGFEEPAALQPRIGNGNDRPIDRFAELRSALHDVCVAKIGPELQSLSSSPDELRGRVQTVVEVELDRRSDRFTAEERRRVVDDVIDEVLGYGPIDPFLRDDEITEVMVNGHDQVFVERAGVLYETDACFADDQHLMRVIERIVAGVGRRVDEASPMVDARLPDGSRVNVIVPPLALKGPILTIRKFSADALTADDLIDLGSLSPSSSTCSRAAFAASSTS